MPSLRALLERLRHPESFLGPVLTLVSGTAVAHFITAGALVILARLYSPAEFGVLGMFTAIFFSVSVVSCLRFDIAIPLPREERDAVSLVGLSMLSALGVAAVAGLLIAIVPDALLDAAGMRSVGPHLWLLPIALLAAGMFSSVQAWFVRQRNYGGMARARAAQSFGAAATQIAAGGAGIGPVGLILGVVLNAGTGAIIMARSFLSRIKQAGGWSTPHQLRTAAIQYRRFPIYSTWEALANSMAVQIPILVVAGLTNTSEVGQLMMAMNVVQAPLALFGTATAQVYLSQAPAKAHDGDLRPFTLKTIVNLLRVGTPLMLAIGIISPFAFPLLFGPEWQRAGILVSWMAPWLLLQFAYGPVSMTFHILGRQRLALVLQIGGLCLRAGVTYAGGMMLAGRAGEFYALSGALFYALGLLTVFTALRPTIGIEK